MSRRRGIAGGFAAAALAVGILGLLAAISVLGAGAELTTARTQVADARQALSAADVDAATAAFGAAADRFEAGRERLATMPVRVVSWVPGIRANVVAVRRLAAAGALVAEAGGAVTGELASLPGGMEAFAPRDGTISLEPIAALAGPLADAAEQVAEAEQLVAGAPQRGLLAPVADARTELAHQLTDTTRLMRRAAALADQLPAFLGAHGPRRYFLGAQNPAELRGTGGLIGTFGILTADQGRVDISQFQSIGQLTRAAPDELPAPSDDFASRYARFSAGIHGSNVNMTPDVPTAAIAIETLYEAATGEDVDGTILADPRFLEALLTVVGPTEVADVGTVTAEDVVAFVTRDQYQALEAADDRKEVLGEVAGAVLRRFLAGDAEPLRAVSALAAAAGDGRLRLHATDPAVQAAFVTAGVDGALADPAGDYIAVVGNNAAANKLDTFLRQEVAYDARLQPGGAVEGRLTLTVTNTAPTTGFHQTVLGPNIDSLVAGENRTYWSVYCAPGCELTGFRRNGEETAASPERERGRPVFSSVVTLASGESETLEYRWTVPGAWTADSGYRLAVDGQPSLMDGATTVRVLPGDGASGVTGILPMTTQGGAATWEGDPSDRVVLRADAQPPNRTVARRIADFFNRPILEWAADKVGEDAQQTPTLARWWPVRPAARSSLS